MEKEKRENMTRGIEEEKEKMKNDKERGRKREDKE